MLRPIRSLFIGVTVGLPFLSIMLMRLLPRHLYYGNGAGFLLGLGIFSFIPSLLILGLYYADCSGTSKVQRMIIYPDKLVYSGYSGRSFQQIRFLSVIDSIDSYHMGKWKIKIRGRFKFTYTGKWEETKIKTHLSIMRTLEDEETLLASLDALQGKKGGREYAADEHGRRI